MTSGFAKELAERAHQGQTDKEGKPYIEHIYAVANGVKTDNAKTVAYLHDIVEDTRWSLEELTTYFPLHIIDAVEHLTHRRGESYGDYIQRVKQNALATEVKLSDLRHNMDINRISAPQEKDFERVVKYKKAYKELSKEGV